jgi:hypothetical protein
MKNKHLVLKAIDSGINQGLDLQRILGYRSGPRFYADMRELVDEGLVEMFYMNETINLARYRTAHFRLKHKGREFLGKVDSCK